MDRLRQYLQERLAQHTDNLRLWENGYLVPTAEDAMEVETTKAGLRGAIYELQECLKQLE